MGEYRLWTKEEEDFLKRAYATHGASEIGEALDRTVYAVRRKARQMGLLKPKHEELIIDGKKQCTICKRWLELDEHFHKSTSGRTPSGYFTICKFCCSTKQRKIRKIERLKEETAKIKKVCAKCGEEKEGWAFPWHSGKMNRENTCQSCSSAQDKKNRIKRIQNDRDW